MIEEQHLITRATTLPLRNGVVAHFVLPIDLSKKEAEKIKAYIDVLAMSDIELEKAKKS